MNCEICRGLFRAFLGTTVWGGEDGKRLMTVCSEKCALEVRSRREIMKDNNANKPALSMLPLIIDSTADNQFIIREGKDGNFRLATYTEIVSLLERFRKKKLILSTMIYTSSTSSPQEFTYNNTETIPVAISYNHTINVPVKDFKPEWIGNGSEFSIIEDRDPDLLQSEKARYYVKSYRWEYCD